MRFEWQICYQQIVKSCAYMVSRKCNKVICYFPSIEHGIYFGLDKLKINVSFAVQFNSIIYT